MDSFIKIKKWIFWKLEDLLSISVFIRHSLRTKNSINPFPCKLYNNVAVLVNQVKMVSLFFNM